MDHWHRLTLGADGSLGSKDHGHVDSPYMIGSLGSLDQGGQFFSETFQSAKPQLTNGIYLYVGYDITLIKEY